MKKILLRPYPGHIVLVRTVADFKRQYKRIFKKSYTGRDDFFGLTVTMTRREVPVGYLVYANREAHNLAHELGHVILSLFDYVGVNPSSSNGEPMCYMLSYLMEQAAKK